VFLRLCDPFRKKLITPSRKFISEQSLFLLYPRAYSRLTQTPRGRLSIAPAPTGYGHGRKSRVITAADDDDDDNNQPPPGPPRPGSGTQQPVQGGAGGAGGGAAARKKADAVHVGYGVEWEPNSQHPQCTACGRKFGILVRRHHCRMCGTVVCADCSKARVTMATVEGSGAGPPGKRGQPTGLSLDAAKSGDLASDTHVEKERVCVACTDLLLRSEAFLSQTTKPGGAASMNGYTPDQAALQRLVDSALQDASGGDASVAVRLLIFSDLVIVSRPLTMDNEIDVSSTNVPLSVELPPFQITAVVAKAQEDERGQFFVCLGLPSREQLNQQRSNLAARKSTLAAGGVLVQRGAAANNDGEDSSMFELSFRLRCCDKMQMDYIVDTINEATQIFLDEQLAAVSE
jgi:hypothetical protein